MYESVTMVNMKFLWHGGRGSRWRRWWWM